MSENVPIEGKSGGKISAIQDLQPRDLVNAVRTLYRATGRFDEAIAEKLQVDLSALRAINVMENGSVSPKYILEQLGLKSASVTALLDRLEKAGHITRTVSAHDRRSWDITLTKDAAGATEALYNVLGATIAEVFAGRSAKELEIAIQAINDLVTSLDTAADKIS
ncbi:MAG: MarR family transcriptional regulator [Hyphomicrobiales bacterium]